MPESTQALRSGRVVVGAPDDPLEREAKRQADRVAEPSNTPALVSPDSTGAVRRQGSYTLTDNPIANAITSGVRKGASFIAAQIEKLAPGAVAFFRNIRDFFKNAFNKGVDSLFGGIVASLREKGLVATLEAMIGSFAAGAVNAVGGFVSGQCAAFGRLAEYLQGLAAKLGSGILEQVKKGYDAIREPLENLWTEYGAPAIDWVKKKLAGAWKEVESTAAKIWNWLKPLREGIATLWNEVTDFLIESRRSYNEWLEWVVPKAIDAWEELKVKIKPYMEHVKTAAKVAGAVALLLSPAGPFVVIGAAMYGLYQGAKLLWEKWGKGLAQDARRWWADEGLPRVQSLLKDVQGKVDVLKQKVDAGLQQLYDAFMKVLGALGVLSFLASVKAAIEAVAQKVAAFREKLAHQIEAWSKKLHELLVAADPYLQQMKEVFRQTLLVALVGPLAFLDDGVWNTINKIVGLVLKTPCLRELAGLFFVKTQISALGRVRDGMKQAWEVIKNPDPLLEKLKVAIEPLVAKIEPEVRSRIEAGSEALTVARALHQRLGSALPVEEPRRARPQLVAATQEDGRRPALALGRGGQGIHAHAQGLR